MEEPFVERTASWILSSFRVWCPASAGMAEWLAATLHPDGAPCVCSVRREAVTLEQVVSVPFQHSGFPAYWIWDQETLEVADLTFRR